MTYAALEREKSEIADATAKLTQLENRKRSSAAQLDALRGELEEWSSKIQSIKEGARFCTGFRLTCFADC